MHLYIRYAYFTALYIRYLNVSGTLSLIFVFSFAMRTEMMTLLSFVNAFAFLAPHRAELMERYVSCEASHKQLTKELDEKHQYEKEVF